MKWADVDCTYDGETVTVRWLSREDGADIATIMAGRIRCRYLGELPVLESFWQSNRQVANPPRWARVDVIGSIGVRPFLRTTIVEPPPEAPPHG